MWVRKEPYVAGQLPDFHSVHCVLVHPGAFIMTLHVIGVLLLVLVLLKEEMNLCDSELWTTSHTGFLK